MKKNIFHICFYTTVLILVFYFNTQAQSGIGVGGYLGGGVISGDSPNQSAFTSSVFFEFKTPFSDNILPRVSFIYAQDFNRLLPESTNKYFPFLKGISLNLNRVIRSVLRLKQRKHTGKKGRKW